MTDADTHVHPLAIRLLVARLTASPRIAAVTGGPHVTNRTNFLCAMQIIEAASIIGLIRRTQALTGRVGVVAGVLALFRKDAVQAVGGYRGEMATEDIDLSWRLLLAGWLTSYEPAALVGMQVPAQLPALWAQRRRWARGQGEVLRVHFGRVLHPRHWAMWPLALEALASLVWILGLTAFVLLQLIHLIGYSAGIRTSWAGLGLAWGVAIAVVATVQLAFALGSPFPTTAGHHSHSCSARSTRWPTGCSRRSPPCGRRCRRSCAGRPRRASSGTSHGSTCDERFIPFRRDGRTRKRAG